MHSRFYTTGVVLSEEVEKKLKAFKALEKGWHFGEGARISTRALAAARRLLHVAFSANPQVELDIFPGIAGEVRVCVYSKQDYYEFTVEPDYTVTFRREENDVEVGDAISLTLNEAADKISAAAAPQWPSFASFPPSTITTEGSDALSVLLSAQGRTGRFQPSQRIVWQVAQFQIVPTFESSTPRFFRTFSFDSISQLCPAGTR